MARVRFDWIGQGWIGQGWIGLDGTGLDWTGMDWFGLDWEVGLGWIGMESALDWTGWVGLVSVGLQGSAWIGSPGLAWPLLIGLPGQI